MTRVFLAAGVAALAITAQATAGPHGDKGGAQTAQTAEPRPGKAARAARVQAAPVQRAERVQRVAVERPQRMAVAAAPQRIERVQRQQVRAERVQPARTRVAERQQVRVARTQPAQTRVADRQQVRAARVQPVQTRQVDRQQLRANRIDQAQALQSGRQQLRADRQASAQTRIADRQALRTDRVALRADRVAQVRALAAQPIQTRVATSYGTRIIPMTTAQSLVGVPLTTAATVAMLSPLPQTVQYLYPDTPDYYYRYGDGYMYQVDRSSNLIAALLPLLGGGYMPGQYLPSSYMNSYMPDYYGYSSFYPDSQYSCNRYEYGVVYQVDCVTGMVENVIPTYAGGYGIGQMLPTDYSYYNVPQQYRSMYYDTPDSGYWYAPGAIYQYDRSSSMISSVAALLSPGFTIGQPLPMGYSSYNVPYDYRATYYDTPNANYRYNNGYIYQIDPTTQLVSAIVASILT